MNTHKMKKARLKIQTRAMVSKDKEVDQGSKSLCSSERAECLSVVFPFFFFSLFFFLNSQARLNNFNFNKRIRQVYSSKGGLGGNGGNPKPMTMSEKYKGRQQGVHHQLLNTQQSQVSVSSPGSSASGSCPQYTKTAINLRGPDQHFCQLPPKIGKQRNLKVMRENKAEIKTKGWYICFFSLLYI